MPNNREKTNIIVDSLETWVAAGHPCINESGHDWTETTNPAPPLGTRAFWCLRCNTSVLVRNNGEKN